MPGKQGAFRCVCRLQTPLNGVLEALVRRADHKSERQWLQMLFESSPLLYMLKHEPTFKEKKKKKECISYCLGTIEKSCPCPIRNNNRVKQTHKQKKTPNQKTPQKLPVTLLRLPWGKLQRGNIPVGAKTQVAFPAFKPSSSVYLKSRDAYNSCSKKLTKLILNISQRHSRNTC